MFAAVAFTAISKIEVNGPIYRNIYQSKDLVAAYVPPSQNLLQMALICNILDGSSRVERQRQLPRFAAARKAFEEEHVKFVRDPSKGISPELIGGEAYLTATQFIEVAQSEFIPAIEDGRREQAHAILTSRLMPLFDLHSRAVDRIVTQANQEAHRGEVQAARMVRIYESTLAGVGLLLLLSGGAFALTIARGISRHEKELTQSEQSLRLTNQALRVLSQCNAAVVQADDEDTLLREVCSIVVGQAGYKAAWVGYADTDEVRTVRPVAWAGIAEATLDEIRVSWGENEVGWGTVGVAIRTGKPVVAHQLLRHPGFAAWRGFVRKLNYGSAIAVPLKGSGAVFGALTIYSVEPDSFQAREADLIGELGSALAHGIVSLRARRERAAAWQALEEARAELEQRVRERTAELLVAKESAESADRLKSAFLATMSHELRTPLNSIIGFTGICLQEMAGPLNPEQKKQLGMVQSSSRHLLALINDVLDISKIEAGQLEVRLEPFDVRQSMEKVVDSIRPQAQKRGLTVSLEIAPGVAVIASDRRRVEQVLLNLLSNAVKFTERGGVWITCAVRGSWLSTSVRDSGSGIDPRDMDRLFRPFRQLDTGLSRKHEGTGLGLSICKRLVEMMGGLISVESRPGEGSTFTYSLPLRGECESDDPGNRRQPTEHVPHAISPATARVPRSGSDGRQRGD